MAPIYADHPFPLLQTPVFLANNKGEKPDMFDKIASEMAHVHNMLIRGLNSIILQAPHIKSADEKAFCKYIMGWYNLLHSHHSGEEAIFFPTVERMAGTKGIMDTNIDQHKAFHDGVDELKGYAQAVVADQEKYAGTKVVSLIDRFGNPLIQHLADEIPTILSLRQYGEEKMAGLPNEFDAEGDKAMRELGPSGMVWAFANLDMNYENGLWPNWPPAPGPVKVLMQSVFWWIYADARKFGAVDRTGTLRHLYAVP